MILNEIQHAWGFGTGQYNGWIRTKSNDSTILYAYGPEVCDAQVRFNKHGDSKIEFYENNSTEPNRIKNIIY